jgi:SAM-dependent methyltransferase
MSSGIARAFDAMARRYDQLEPWYEHLYRELHAILRAELAPPARGRSGRALDAGCGSGFQTAILEELGYDTHGVDLSAGLLALARSRARGSKLTLGDLQRLPYRDGSFEAATCCGSTLSFVGAPGVALGEIGRVMRVGGRLLLECEHKWSLDLAWAFASAATRDPLGYGLSARDLAAKLARPTSEGFELDYPGYPPIRLFTRPELDTMLRVSGLRPLRAWGLHSITNVIPSTVLHGETLLPRLRRLYAWLCALDSRLAATAPARWLGNSLVVLAVKV